MKARIVLVIVAFVRCAAAQSIKVSDLLNSSHNLSAGGPGPVTSIESRPCVICHISHKGYTDTFYLWNHQRTSSSFLAYQSPTLNASPGNPAAGPSKLCLSCHDGTVALGQTVALGLVPTSGSMSSGAITGVDFGRHHPVGIRPVDDGQLYAGLSQTPATTADASVRLRSNLIECVTCHDPHSENIDVTRGRFLVRSNQASAICLACHDSGRPAPNQLNGWVGSAHQSATNTRSELYGTVAANACLSCHLPHNPSKSLPLLRAAEENACSPCHAGSGTNPALLSVVSQFSLSYAHPAMTLSGLHAPGENSFPLNNNRHAECFDCHNSHASRAVTFSPTPPALSPAQQGTSGVDGMSGTTPLRPASNEYEVCFKCHANSLGKPQAVAGYSQYGRTAWRVTDSTATDSFNTRLEFNSSVSRHNVTFPRQRTSAQVPSLRASMLNLNGSAARSLGSGTYIYCGDCHNSNQARNSGGTQASGAHGSTWPHILERRNESEPPPASPGGSTPGVTYQAGLTGTYALCYKCHDISGQILQNTSFKEHNKHINGARTACNTCHDPHGINGGNITNNPSLVNFDTTIVGPSSSGALRFERTGTFRGRCYLTCHGKNHNPLSY